MPSRPLPDDIESLKRLVIEQRAALLSRDVEIEKLKIELARLKRMQFGRSSEQLDQTIAQLELSLEELEASAAETAPVLDTQPAAERIKPARRALPESLPRETVVHEAPCNCPACGGALRAFGEDEAEILEYVPSRFKVIRHVPSEVQLHGLSADRPSFGTGPADRPRACRWACWLTYWCRSMSITCR